MSDQTPGLLVARRVLFKIALWCTVLSVATIAITSLIPGTATTNGFEFVTILMAIVFYIGVACWIAYAVVRMVGRERLGARS